MLKTRKKKFKLKGLPMSHPYNKAQNSQGQKLFHKRFIPETLKSTQSVNHRNNPFIAHDSYFPRIMTVPISE